MKPVDQSILYHEGSKIRGDCYRACIASILELPLEEVPHFMQIDVDTKEYYLGHVQNWLLEKGMFMMSLPEEINEYYKWIIDEKYPGYVIASGVSPRQPEGKTLHHAVVMKSGKIVHDPHPSREGLVGEPLHYEIIVRCLDDK